MPNASGTSKRSNNPLPFHPREGGYKTPFGAIATGRTAHLLFPVSADWNAESVTFFLRRAEYLEKYPLTYLGREGDYDDFALDFSVDRNGTYYYRFEIYHKGGGVTYVGKGSDGGAVAGEWLPEWILNVYSYEYETPDHFKGGVVYHLSSTVFVAKEKSPNPNTAF